jgi:hypothetical protein
LLNRSPIAQEIRARIDKWDCIPLKKLCALKETIFRVMRYTTEWQKIFARYLCDKGLISTICK